MAHVHTPPETDEFSMHFTRSVAVSTKAKTIYGYAIVYNSPSVDLGGYKEVIAKGAFDTDIATGKNIRCLYEHDPANVLGQTSDGTLVLTPDDKGVAFELTLPDTPFGQTVYDNVKAGKLDGMSFGFRTRLMAWDLVSNPAIKTVNEGTMTEVTVTSSPAYESTVALTRSKKQKQESKPQLNKLDENLHRLTLLS